MEDNKCFLAHPNHPHNLSSQLIKDNKSNCFRCGKPILSSGYRKFHYHCIICDVDFHEGCERYPRKILHPFHLQHPLFLTYKRHGNITNHSNIEDNLCLYEGLSVISSSSTLDPGKLSVFDNCTWCGANIEYTRHRALFYRCSICSFCLDVKCAKRNPNLTIQNPKGHHHSLVFFPRPLLVPCDACGLVNASQPSYACFQCNYMVHQSCVYLPRVIKITRHQHRLSYSPYLPPPNSICRVCYKSVDVKYGQYSCKEEDCSYVLHSRCATHKAIWDGKELEWEPEELGVNQEDIAPFKKVGDDLIKHFSHKHHLKLEKYKSGRDEKKLCQACILPIDLHDFYNCIQCDYFLHLVCASLLKKVDHALHVHSLILEPSPQVDHALHNRSPLPEVREMSCSACSRMSTGFQYKCPEENCENFGFSFKIDARCFLVPEYGTNKIHEHPLFIVPNKYDRELFDCNGCKKRLSASHLQCTLCEFSVCYQCITIPNELHYKYDEHPLILCYGEDTNCKYWCEECEKEVDPSEWFYTCNKCCITIHRKCLFGFFAYMKPGSTYHDYYCNDMVEVVGNNSSTRPVCSHCKDRCRGSTYFKVGVWTLCSSCRLELHI